MKTILRSFYYSIPILVKWPSSFRQIYQNINITGKVSRAIHSNLFRIGLPGLFILLMTSTCRKDPSDLQTMIDFDGNIYQTVQIGNQLWMKDNLRVTHYNNGEAIPQLQVSSLVKSKTGYYTDYELNKSWASTYGHLYNAYVLSDNRGICPKGWHIPTISDWELLISSLGGPVTAGVILGRQGAQSGSDLQSGSNAESGFHTLFSGFYDECGLFLGLGKAGYYWSSSSNSKQEQGYIYSSYLQNEIVLQWDSPQNNFSVRLVKDQE